MTALCSLGLVVLLGAGPAPKPANSARDDDAVLQALSDEIARYTALKVGSLDRPYYVAGAVGDVDQLEIGASFGALVSHWRNGSRVAHIDLRVGTPDLDNTNFARSGGFMFGDMFGAMHGVSSLPWEPDYDAVRQALWLSLDGQYKEAVEALARKKAYLQTNLVAERPPDFSPAKATEVILPRAVLSVDEARWIRTVKRASAVFRAAPAVLTGTATLDANAQNQCFASSDPVRDRFGDVTLKLVLRASAQASDGMQVSATYEADGRTDADLPSEAQSVQAAKDLLARLTKLAQAPVLSEEYSGPVLFTGRAADWFFLKGLGEPLSHPRDPLGRNKDARMIDRLGKHVAAPMVTVRDDPTQKTWKGKPLFGGYPIDDEGVLPQPITLVEKGVLKTYYMSRVPTAKIAQSNGHARGDAGGVANLFVETKKGESRSSLKRKLIELAKENDEAYGLLVEDFTDPSSGGREAMMEMMRSGGRPAGGDIKLPRPSIVYRVFPDGREELVRGATFKAVSFQTLKDIVGMGDAPSVLNTISGGQQVSVVAPAVLVKQLELKGPTEEFEKPPALPRPVVDAAVER